MPTAHFRPCPACQSSDGRAIGQAGDFTIRSCGGCGTLFTARLPSEDEGLDYGTYHGPGKAEVPAFVLMRLEQIVSTFDPYRQLNRWLDVGCGAGTLMRAARSRGWEVAGTDVGQGAVEGARAAGFDVRLGELGELDLPRSGFDVVSMVEVLEHVPDPDALLGQAAGLLRPGGALYLTTPHARGLSARLLGTRWSIVAPPEHLQLYSVPGLRTAMEGAGFVVRSMRIQAVNPHELLAAVRRRGAAGGFGERKETSYRLNESLSTNAPGALAKAAVNAVLTVTQLGDSIKVVANTPSASADSAAAWENR